MGEGNQIETGGRPASAREETTMQTNQSAELHASMEAQRAMLLRECGVQDRELVRADAHVSARGHLPLRHRARARRMRRTSP
jgi:hypothetical protein